MSIFFTCFIIGISLSMDAFSLALLYGTYGFSFKNQLMLSIIVGFFHFVMPLIGLWFGNNIFRYFIFSANLAVGVIFSIIGIEMILSIRRDEDVKIFSSIWGYLLFGFTVSIDSLTTGIGLSAITSTYFMACFMFMVCSGLFTYLGLRLGNQLNMSFGKYASLFGGIIMVVLGAYYIFKI